MKIKRGRPAKAKLNVTLVTADQAVELIVEELRRRHPGNEVIVERMSYSKGTIYNLISQGKLTRYGTQSCVLLDTEEIKRKLCG